MDSGWSWTGPQSRGMGIRKRVESSMGKLGTCSTNEQKALELADMTMVPAQKEMGIA